MQNLSLDTFAPAAATQVQDAQANALLTPQDVADIMLASMHAKAGASLPRTPDGSAYYLQSAPYLEQVVAQLRCPKTLEASLASHGLGNLSFNTRAIAVQIMVNERDNMQAALDNRYHPHIGARVDALRESYGLPPISWTTSPFSGPAAAKA
jgi:hypothetical protein